jgi:hypothetical protein
MLSAGIVETRSHPRSIVAALLESLIGWYRSPWGRRVSGLLPWLLLILYTGWATAPLWQAESSVFAGKFSSDNAVSAWYYSWVARSLESGAPMATLSDFNYPSPWPRAVEFPNVVDATLTAPLWWLYGWPGGWGASQAMTVFVTGLGCAALARALGCRGIGLLLAGVLGVLCRQLWKDLVMARMNAVWPGLVLLALAALILAIRRPEGVNRSRNPIGRSLLAVAAGGLGALAAGVYPPYLLLLAPAGLMLVFEPLRRTDRLGWILLGGGLGLGLILGWGTLSEIIASRDLGGTSSAGCPNRYGAVTYTDLFRGQADIHEGLSLPGLASGSWMLMGLVLLHRRWLAGLGLLTCIAVLMVLSLGPCPQSSEGVELIWRDWPGAGLLPGAWERLSAINDWGRMASLAALLAAICAGLGVERIWRWGYPGRVAALILSGVAVSQAQSVLFTERLDPLKWHAVPPPLSAQFLQTAELGPVADLPFDRKQQFLSVLWAPDHPRINPLRPADHPPQDPFIQWLFSLSRTDGEFVMELGDPRGVTGLQVECRQNGQVQWAQEVPLVGNQLRIGNLPQQAVCSGQLVGPEIDAPIASVRSGMDLSCTIRSRSLQCRDRMPSLDQAQRSGIRWVIVDQPRCATEWFSAPVCGPEGKQALQEVLGAPLEWNGIQIWDLSTVTP